ncbi:MAG TPA: LysR family transcriptional regulator, partial [Chloroflexota bacterium]
MNISCSLADIFHIGMDLSSVSSLPELRVLVALANGKTLALAGAELFVSQPTASKLLQSLERKVGVTLTERRGRRLLLTAAGAEIAAGARSVLSDVNDLERAVERMRAGEAGLLRVIATHTPGNYVLPPRLAAFHRTHPAVQIELSIVPNQDFWPLLLGGSHDLGVVPLPLEPVAPWLAADPLYADPVVFFAAAGNPLAGRCPLR